jgi:pyrimidine 5'-nucleotidase
MNLSTIFFDLDSTLYPESNGLWQAIRERIDLYMHERMGLPFEQIPTIRHEYFQHYGTTLRGLEAHYGVDQHEYLNFVHDLPLADYLEPDLKLRQMLLSIPRRRWILTNSDIDHVTRVLNILAISDCFEGTVDIFSLNPYCKPQREAFQRALEIVGVADAKECAFLDDSPSNLLTASELGFYTILVGTDGDSHPADLSLKNLLDLPKYAPILWM